MLTSVHRHSQLNSSILYVSIIHLTCSIVSLELKQTILRMAKAPFCIPSNPHVSIYKIQFAASKATKSEKKKKPIDRNVGNYLGQIFPMQIKRSVNSLLYEQYMCALCLLAGHYLWARATTDKQKQ